MELTARDCSPLCPQPTGEDMAWLRTLAAHVEASRHVVAFGGDRKDDDPLVYCERDGTWWAGRYIGSVTFAGHRITIKPRLGISTLRDWLYQATVDAKYKRLTPRASAPHGPERNDLYQISSYLARYGRDIPAIQGSLLYPQDPADLSTARAEAGNPWRLEHGRKVHFLTLPHELGRAAAKLRACLALEVSHRAASGHGRGQVVGPDQAHAGGLR